MRGLKLLCMAVTLTAAASAAPANMPTGPDEDEPEASDGEKGGNAIDKATEAATRLPLTGAGSLPPEGYAIIGDFLASMARGDGWSAAEVVLEAWKQQGVSSSPFGWLAPVDGPAESVLDQIDESQAPLPMVGEAGSDVTVAAPSQPTPPPESILDFIDQPAPPPAPPAAEDVAKPAANMAQRPGVSPPAPPP